LDLQEGILGNFRTALEVSLRKQPFEVGFCVQKSGQFCRNKDTHRSGGGEL
jgi:hypothetical protein